MEPRTNEQWLEELRLQPPGNQEAVGKLRDCVLQGLRYAFERRRGVEPAFLEDQAQEAVLRILDKLDTFRGESRFLTWANKVAVRLTLTEVKKREWKNVSLEDFESAEEMFPTPMAGPEDQSVRNDMMGMLKEIIESELTERQRQAMAAIRFHGMPLEEVASRMGTNRNALYKLMHDARLRLKQALTEKGISVEEIMETFG